MNNQELFELCERHARLQYDLITKNNLGEDYAYAAINRSMQLLRDYMDEHPRALSFQVKQAIQKVFQY